MKILSTLTMLILSVAVVSPVIAQKDKSCKILKGKDGKGNVIEMTDAPGKLGRFYVGKKQGKFFISYTTKIAFMLASNETNRTTLGVDSVKFQFEDGNSMTLPAFGSGRVLNEVRLKHTFDYVQFEAALDDNSVKKFLSTNLAFVQIFGQKEAGMNDMLVEKNRPKLIKAFECWN